MINQRRLAFKLASPVALTIVIATLIAFGWRIASSQALSPGAGSYDSLLGRHTPQGTTFALGPSEGMDLSSTTGKDSSGEELSKVISALVSRPVFPHRDTRRLLPSELEPVRQRLQAHVAEWVEGPALAPLRMEIGLAGQELFFAHSSEVILALAFAYPHLDDSVRLQTATFLRRQWEEHPPFGSAGWYPPTQGARRELYTLPPELTQRLQVGEKPHPMAHLYSVWAYGYYLGVAEAWREVWTNVKEIWQDFRKQGLKPVSKQDRLWSNAYLGGLIAIARMAKELGDEASAQQAEADCLILAQWVVDRFRADARRLAIPEITNVNDFDRWRAEDLGGFFLVLRPHKAKPDKVHGLVPEVGMLLAQLEPDSAQAYLDFVDKSLPGWYLMGEERQFHYGENFVDYPDFALGIFQAKAYFGKVSLRDLVRWIDIPLSKGDAYFVHKAAIVLHLAAGGSASH
ncbi:MAG: hypothetical protein RMJ16_08485 [Thermoguttaceae bacterium]|nr:hypothetical protein [Thermoguttaceae bacterium]